MPRKKVRVFKNKSIRYRRNKKVSKVYTHKGVVTYVHRPMRHSDFMPDLFVTTHYVEYFGTIALGIPNSMSGNNNYFNIQALQVNTPLTAHSASSFQLYSAMSPAITLRDDSASTINPVGYLSLSSIYDYYAVLDTAVDISVDNYETGGDVIRMVICPIQVQQNSIATNANPYTQFTTLSKQRWAKDRSWQDNISCGRRLKNKVNWVEFFGYPNLKAYLADTDNHMITANTNIRPTQDTVFEVGCVSALSGATAGVVDISIRLKYRACWHGISNPIPSN